MCLYVKLKKSSFFQLLAEDVAELDQPRAVNPQTIKQALRHPITIGSNRVPFLLVRLCGPRTKISAGNWANYACREGKSRAFRTHEQRFNLLYSISYRDF